MYSRFGILARTESPKTKANGSVAFGRGHTQRSKHMRWLGNVGRTSGPCGRGEPRLQGSENILGIKSVKTEIGIARMPLRESRTWRAVDNDRELAVVQKADEMIA